MFLSTSRVYAVEPLRNCRLTTSDLRFDFYDDQETPGLSEAGVAESFPTAGEKSLYGATKLAGEIMVQEFGHAFQIPVLINRCGVLAGPWQFGRVDQGVVPYWVDAHVRQKPLKYIGFGGSGRQVRDVLHIDDLVDLVRLQLEKPSDFNGRIFNVGGGKEGSVSLRELTTLCEEVVGNKVEITPEQETRYADIPVYVTDNAAITAHCGWEPKRSPAQVVEDITRWLRS